MFFMYHGLAGKGSIGKAGNEMSKAVEKNLSKLQNVFVQIAKCIRP